MVAAIMVLAAWAIGGFVAYRRRFPKGIFVDERARVAAERIRRTGRRRIYPRPVARR